MFIKMSLLSKNTLKKYNLFHWENTSEPRLNFTTQKMIDFYLTSSWEAFSYFSSFVSIKINSRHTTVCVSERGVHKDSLLLKDHLVLI